MAKTTVVIPNYNGIKYIDGCLRSLYKGSVHPEIILVDNGSTDGSLSLVKEKYPLVKVIEFAENTGFSKAVNAGIRMARTEYVLLLNNDTVSGQEMMACLEKAMDDDPVSYTHLTLPTN